MTQDATNTQNTPLAAAAEELVRQALAHVAPEADLERLDPTAELQEALDLDSMDFLNFVTAVHEATQIDIPERDYPQITTQAACVGYLVSRAG